MAITFFSDPHLGAPRKANTTPASTQALQLALFTQAMLVADQALALDQPLACGGDAFDRYSNPEAVTLQGLQLAQGCNLVLAGNHDVVAQQGKIGSFQLVDRALINSDGGSPCVIADFGKPKVVERWLGDFVVTAVPHVSTQGLFEQSLGMAMDSTLGERRGVLLLHCNYDLPTERATETTLNLLPEHVEELLTAFDYILMGHEHAPAEHFGGRLIVIGNTHPTGFADISDKRTLHWNGSDWSETVIWRAAEGYAELDCRELPRQTQANFLRVTGKVEPANLLAFTRDVTALWERSPSLYGVKLDLDTEVLVGPDGRAVSASVMQLPEIVRQDLAKHPKWLALWDQFEAEEAGQ